jgi:hypothetical protein
MKYSVLVKARRDHYETESFNAQRSLGGRRLMCIRSALNVCVAADYYAFCFQGRTCKALKGWCLGAIKMAGTVFAFQAYQD